MNPANLISERKIRSPLMRFIALAALLIPITLAVYITNFPLKKKLEDRLISELSGQGFSDVRVSIAALNNKSITFSNISFAKEKLRVDAEWLNITATNMPYQELLRSNYTNLAANWTVKSISVSGIPYELPPITGGGVYYMKDKNATIAGEMHDAKRTHQTEFTVTPKTVLLENIKAVWNGAKLSADEVVYNLQEKKPTLIPLKVKDLPLTFLLSALSGDKATGTGMVSGYAEIIVYPDGTFGLGEGMFTTGSQGVIHLSPDALPGDQPQMELARNALANFHYNDLSITLSPDNDGKVMISMSLGGNNPEAFDGKPVKLNVNLSGDVLELLQQTLLPLADPKKYLEKGTK